WGVRCRGAEAGIPRPGRHRPAVQRHLDRRRVLPLHHPAGAGLMTRNLTLAAIQTSYGEDMAANIAKTEGFIRQAAAEGAQVILPSELFQGPYFCVAQEERWFKTAYPWREHPCVTALAPLAKELGVVLPVSIFEREGP